MLAPQQPSVKLFRGFDTAAHYTWSPFVNKLEARLRFGGVSYGKDVGSPMKAPRGKIPYATLALSPDQPDHVLGDSKLIIDALRASGTLSDLNAQLSPVAKAQDLSLRALLEDKAYFYSVHERWIENYYTMRSGVLKALPYPMQVLVGLLAWRANSQTLHGQGTARYSLDEIALLRTEVWDAVDAFVADAKSAASTKSAQPGGSGVFWLFKGEEPTEADATVFGFITSSLLCPAATDTAALVRSYPAIMEYAKRIHERFFPDYTFWDE